ncbi:MAG: MBL fold metallo-hydrolase [Oligoflexia bacterium]|nr:MBL fold metallo-hydrolase [Oligoflexia bacterium]
MILKILGCGTSTGVPIPGCDCAVCSSPDPKNHRNRTSALIKLDSGDNILIDASTDLRQQALRWNVRRINAMLLTHAHADHILGMDDLRCFNFTLRAPIPCYGLADSLQDVRRVFSYVFDPDPNYEGGMLPQITLNPIEAYRPITILGTEILPFELRHGRMTVLGFRCGNIAYATDCKTIPERSITALKGVRFLVLDGLRYEQHRTHLTIDEAIEIAGKIGAEKTYLTHMTHSVDYSETMAKLPPHVELAYDGLEIPGT